MDKKQTANFIKQIMGAYPAFNPTPERLEIWSRLMAKIDYDLAILRLDKHVSNSSFPPTIADILNPDGEAKKNKFEDYCETTGRVYEFVDLKTKINRR